MTTLDSRPATSAAPGQIDARGPRFGAAVTTVVNAQSPKGTTQVYLPDYAAYSAIYTLRTGELAGWRIGNGGIEPLPIS